MLKDDYLEVRQPGELYEYDGGKHPTRVDLDSDRGRQAVQSLDETARRLLYAEGLRRGDRVVSADVSSGRVECPRFAIDAARAILECERRNDYGGLHAQAVRDFREGCPSGYADARSLSWWLPDGSHTTDITAAIVSWAA